MASAEKRKEIATSLLESYAYNGFSMPAIALHEALENKDNDESIVKDVWTQTVNMNTFKKFEEGFFKLVQSNVNRDI